MPIGYYAVFAETLATVRTMDERVTIRKIWISAQSTLHDGRVHVIFGRWAILLVQVGNLVSRGYKNKEK